MAGCGRPGRTNGLPSPRGRTRIGFGERLYVPSLPIASELLAFTAIGLIARRGEVFPRWVPYLSGRQVPRWAADFPGEAGGWESAWFSLCYAPLVLWGPLMVVLTVA